MSDLLKSLVDVSKYEEEYRLKYEAEVNSWWESLPQNQREFAFYAVVSRIYKAEIVEHKSYRGVLYDTFGFDPGFYMDGMNCGYMTLHNSIYTAEEMHNLRDRELAASNVKVITNKTVKEI
jgi:ABC-type Fe3+-citrate transport system substrate-binding protein